MKMHPFLSLTELSRELKRRKVYRVMAPYAVIGWIVLQFGEVTFEPLGLPDSTMTVLVVVVILGFPVAVVLSWLFDITPTGIRRDSDKVVAEIESDDTPSIAVLPFVDMSPDKDQGYFCEGVAEEILNALTKIESLHVAARTSSFQFKEGEGDIRQIGKSLGVKTILEGSVRKSGNQLRVTAQLIKVADGYHLWSKSFDQELKDIFAIQDEIATCIAQSLLDTLTAIKTTSSRDVQAYEHYLRGRQFFNRFRKKDIDFARQMFRQAIDIDPEFALAWAGYADCFSFLMMYVDPKDSYCEEAGKASERALELSPELAEAHASRGLAYLISEEFEQAEAEFEKALELNPSLFEAYYYYGRARFHQGDLEKAADMFAKAAAVNPDDYQSRLLRVQILRGLGRMDEALVEAKQSIAAVEKHLEWNPDDARALHLGAGSLIVSGQIERAERWMRRALEIDPDDSVVLYNVACNYATLGKVETALDCLEQAIENGIVSVAWMRNDEDLVNLRPHPRYEEILKGLENKSSEPC
jgi:adenylate cyclase